MLRNVKVAKVRVNICGSSLVLAVGYKQQQSWNKCHRRVANCHWDTTVLGSSLTKLLNLDWI